MSFTELGFTIFMSKFIMKDTSWAFPSYCLCIITLKLILFT